MQIEFTPRAFARNLGLPGAKLTNMFVEATPGGPGQTARFSRPGLLSNANLGLGPNRGLFANKGVFNSAIFTVSGDQIFAGSTLLGSIDGTDLARSATSTNQRVFVANQKAYLWDGTTFGQITNPNLPACIDVIYFNSTFLYFQANSGRFYYSAPDDAANIDGLSFEDAELKPDPNVGAIAVGDIFYIFGTESTEPWYATGDPTGITPFARALERSYGKGCAGRDTIQPVDNTAFWVGNDRIVYRAENVPTRISNHSVEGMLKACPNVADSTTLSLTFEGHPFYLLNIPGQGSVVYDVAAQDWDDWASYQRTIFRGRASVDLDGVTYVGDDTTNDVWTLSRGTFQDGTEPLIREATAFAPVEAGHPRCDRLSMTCAKGVGLNGVSAPLIEMAYSDDGETWSRWRQASMGAIGKYKQKVYWNRLGRMRAPGRVFWFRTSDPVLASFANLSINGGRA